MLIRTATTEDLKHIAEVETECFPPSEAASEEALANRLEHYANHFWLMFDENRLGIFTRAMPVWIHTLDDCVIVMMW